MANLRITFLGTGAGNCIYRAHTAIALDCPDGTRVLLDAGSGNSLLINGAKLGMFARDFHQVLLSHHHADHMDGLTHLQGQRTARSPDAPPLQVYASEESLQKVERLFHATSITNSVARDGVSTSEGRQVVAWRPVQDLERIDLSAGVGATAFSVDHIPGALGWRINTDGASVVFSGDTRFCPGVAEAARGASVLVHEAVSTETEKEAARRWGHSTAADAARIAAQAGVARLILTHLDSPFHFDQQPLLDEARRYFDGPISVASDLSQFTVAAR